MKRSQQSNDFEKVNWNPIFRAIFLLGQALTMNLQVQAAGSIHGAISEIRCQSNFVRDLSPSTIHLQPAVFTEGNFSELEIGNNVRVLEDFGTAPHGIRARLPVFYATYRNSERVVALYSRVPIGVYGTDIGYGDRVLVEIDVNNRGEQSLKFGTVIGFAVARPPGSWNLSDLSSLHNQHRPPAKSPTLLSDIEQAAFENPVVKLDDSKIRIVQIESEGRPSWKTFSPEDKVLSANSVYKLVPLSSGKVGSSMGIDAVQVGIQIGRGLHLVADGSVTLVSNTGAPIGPLSQDVLAIDWELGRKRF